jgi:hypothetical protein
MGLKLVEIRAIIMNNITHYKIHTPPTPAFVFQITLPVKSNKAGTITNLFQYINRTSDHEKN